MTAEQAGRGWVRSLKVRRRGVAVRSQQDIYSLLGTYNTGIFWDYRYRLADTTFTFKPNKRASLFLFYRSNGRRYFFSIKRRYFYGVSLIQHRLRL